MERIVLIGSGQHSAVVLYNLSCQRKFYAIGFFDSDDSKVGKEYHGYQVLENYKTSDLNLLREKYKTDKFFISFGNMKYRKDTYNLFVNSGWKPVNVIHPSAIISPKAIIGNGVLIEAGCLVTPNPIIGDNVVINTGSQVNHDNIIESHVYIASGVVLSGGVRVGSNTLLDDGVIITLGTSVGSDCLVGAGSVVTKNIPNNCVAYGVPSRIIRENKWNVDEISGL